MVEDLLHFLLREARLTYHPHVYGELPPLEILNEVFERGNGDDGWICMTWVPFRISDDEYQELVRCFKDGRSGNQN